MIKLKHNLKIAFTHVETDSPMAVNISGFKGAYSNVKRKIFFLMLFEEKDNVHKSKRRVCRRGGKGLVRGGWRRLQGCQLTPSYLCSRFSLLKQCKPYQHERWTSGPNMQGHALRASARRWMTIMHKVTAYFSDCIKSLVEIWLDIISAQV